MSDNKQIIGALLKAQREMMLAKKDKKNPFFKSTYATLNAVWEACREPLHNNDLVLLQPITIKDGVQVVTTSVFHTSGESVTSDCPIVCAKQNDPQALGSAITYARRYSLASILGIMTDEDDDGEKAMNRKKPFVKKEPKKEPKPVEPISYDDLICEIYNAKTEEAIGAVYKKWKHLDESEQMYKQLLRLSSNKKDKINNPKKMVDVLDGLDGQVREIIMEKADLDDELPDNVTMEKK